MRAFAGASELTPSQLREAAVHWPRPGVLDVSLGSLKGVGPKLADAAREAGISTVGDLLLRFPHSHRDRTVVPVAELEPGAQGTVEVEVLGNAPRPFRRRGLSITSVKVGDESGVVPRDLVQPALDRAEAGPRRPPAADRLPRQTRAAGQRTRASRRGGGCRGGPGPGPPGDRTAESAADPAVGRAGDRPRRQRDRAAAGRAAGAAESGRGRGRGHRRPFPRGRGGGRDGPRAARLRRALPLPGDPGDAEADPPLGAPGAPPRPARGGGRALGRVAALRPDRRPAGRVRRDRRRPRVRRADAAPADGRGRVGQDRRRPLRDAAGARIRVPGAPDGADRDPRRAARDDPRPAARPRAAAVRAADRSDSGAPPPRGAGAPRDRRARDRRRHPRPDRPRRRAGPARGLRRRRAAPFRGRAAARARREGGRGDGAPRPPHDRDADSAHPLADRLRGPRHHRAARTAGRPPPGRDPPGRGGRPPRRLRVHPRAAARGPPGLRRLPAGLGVREIAGQGRRGRGRAAGADRAAASSTSASSTARCARPRRRGRWRRSPPARSTSSSPRP